MLNIRFEAQDNQCLRVMTFPDGTTSKDAVSFRRQWHDPEPYRWIRPLYELDRQELVEEGKAIAAALLGTSGIRFLDSVSSAEPLPIVIQENGQLPEVARIPWELAFADGRFLATDPCTPIMRRPSHAFTHTVTAPKRCVRCTILPPLPAS